MFNNIYFFNIPNLQLNLQVNIKGKKCQIQCFQTLSESFSNNKHTEKINKDTILAKVIYTSKIF